MHKSQTQPIKRGRFEITDIVPDDEPRKKNSSPKKPSRFEITDLPLEDPRSRQVGRFTLRDVPDVESWSAPRPLRVQRKRAPSRKKSAFRMRMDVQPDYVIPEDRSLSALVEDEDRIQSKFVDFAKMAPRKATYAFRRRRRSTSRRRRRSTGQRRR